MRLRLVKQDTSFDFFNRWKMWLGFSGTMLWLLSTVMLWPHWGWEMSPSPKSLTLVLTTIRTLQ